MSNPETPTNTKKASCCDWRNVAIALGIFIVGLAVGIGSQHIGRKPCPFPGMGGGPGMRCPMGMNGRPGGPGGQMCDPGSRFGGGRERMREGGPRFSEEAREEFKAYTDQIKKVVEPYNEKIKNVMTAEQKAKIDAFKENKADKASHGPEFAKGPGKGRGHDGRGMELMGLIVYQPKVTMMAEKLELTDKQKTQIMKDRRDAFLKFVDQNPPPFGRGHKEKKGA